MPVLNNLNLGLRVVAVINALQRAVSWCEDGAYIAVNGLMRANRAETLGATHTCVKG